MSPRRPSRCGRASVGDVLVVAWRLARRRNVDASDHFAAVMGLVTLRAFYPPESHLGKLLG
jgi:hypothetical protein